MLVVLLSGPTRGIRNRMRQKFRPMAIDPTNRKPEISTDRCNQDGYNRDSIEKSINLHVSQIQLSARYLGVRHSGDGSLRWRTATGLQAILVAPLGSASDSIFTAPPPRKPISRSVLVRRICRASGNRVCQSIGFSNLGICN